MHTVWEFQFIPYFPNCSFRFLNPLESSLLFASSCSCLPFYFLSNLPKEKKKKTHVHFDSVPGQSTLLSESGTPISPAATVRLQKQKENIRFLVKHFPLRSFSHSNFCSRLCAFTESQFCRNPRLNLYLLMCLWQPGGGLSFLLRYTQASARVTLPLYCWAQDSPSGTGIRDVQCLPPLFAGFLCMMWLQYDSRYNLK